MNAPPPFTLPPVSGFWRRFAAFLLDGLLLGLIGQALALSASSLWFELGPYGRFIGQSIALLYFGLLDSRITKGQTLGKRVLGVAVRDSDGESIGVGRSLLRTLVWLVPASLNGWALPVLLNPVVTAVAGLVLFGVGGAVVVTLIFNRRSRQGLHDLLVGTYVVNLKGVRVESMPKAGRLPWVLSASMLVLAVGMAAGSNLLLSRFVPKLQDMAELQQELQKDERFFSFSVVDQTFYQQGRKDQHALVVRGWYRGRPSAAERERLLTEIAAVAMTVDDVERFDLVRVDVQSSYDLGIASGYVVYGDGQSVKTWRERVAGR